MKAPSHSASPTLADDPSAAVRMAALEAENLRLKQQLDWFKRQLFGRKSEKQLLLNPGQASLFSREGPEPPPAQPDKVIPEHRRRTRRCGNEINDTGLRFDDSVPQTVIDVPAPELEGEQASRYEVIDYKESVRLAQQRSIYHVLIYRRPVLRDKQGQTLITAPAPENVLEGSYADVSLLAGLMVDKAVYHLPLHRQHQRLRSRGIVLSRTALLNYVSGGIALLEPIDRAQWQGVLDSTVVAMDEVPMKAGRKGPGQMKQSYFWPIFGDREEVVFTWSASRSRHHPEQQLHGFAGTLLTDGYDVYRRVVAQLNTGEARITHANCWTHSRRGFERALGMEPTLAQHALDLIARLYQVEAAIRERELPPDEIAASRSAHSAPLVDAFFAWVAQQRQRPELLPSNPLTKALVYVHEREASLQVFLGNPGVAMDTNHLERALRVIPMGRKNHLFCWSELGAEQLGILHSLMVTCRLQGINPYDYLVDVLQRVSQHPARDVAALTPRYWKERFAGNPLRSDVTRIIHG